MAYKSKYFQAKYGQREETSITSPATTKTQYKSNYFQEKYGSQAMEQTITPAPMRSPTDKTFPVVLRGAVTQSARPTVGNIKTQQHMEAWGNMPHRANSDSPGAQIMQKNIWEKQYGTVGVAQMDMGEATLAFQQRTDTLNAQIAKIQEVNARGQQLQKTGQELEQIAQNVESLGVKYQQTGADEDYGTYLLAAKMLQDRSSTYQKDVAAYEKDWETVWDGYYEAYPGFKDAERKYGESIGKYHYEATKYLDEHPEVKYRDVGVQELQAALRGVELEKKETEYGTPEYESLNSKQEVLIQLYRQRVLEQDNGLWNSSLGTFVDGLDYATQAGVHRGLAGYGQLMDIGGHAAAKAIGGIMDAVGAAMGNDELRAKAKKLVDANPTVSEGTVELQRYADDMLFEALKGKGKIDGWIIKQMDSVGSMLLDIWLAGTGSASSANSGFSTTELKAANMTGASQRTFLGLRAAGGAMTEALQEGRGTTEAILVGAASGYLEYLAEGMFSGNPMYDDTKGWANKLAELICKNDRITRLLYSDYFDLFGEGIEELFTALASPVSESVITGEKIELPSLEELGDAFAGGMFLSLVGSGVNKAAEMAADAQNAKAYKKLGGVISKAEAVQELVSEGLSAAHDTEAYKLALAMQKQLDKNQMPSTRGIGKLLIANQQAIDSGKLVGDAKIVDKDAVAHDLQKADNGGFYAIQSVEMDGKTMYRAVRVLPNGDIEYLGEAQNDILNAKLFAEMKGLQVEGVGNGAQLAWLARERLQETEVPDEVTLPEAKTAQDAAERSVEEVTAQSVADLAAKSFGSTGQKAFATTLNEVAPDTPWGLFGGFSAYYQAGMTGKDIHAVKSTYANDLPTNFRQIAYDAGAQDAAAKNAVADEGDSAYIMTNDTQEGAVNTYGEEGIHLRDGSQRTGSAYPGGSVSGVEEGAGRNQSWQAETVAADTETARLAYGEKVSTASLGIVGGSTAANIRIVTSGDTASTAKARALAKKRGLQLVLFAGDNLSIREEDGTTASARGYIIGDRVFVRVDHPLYTADQLMRHEAGHDMIAKGEVNPDNVRDRIDGIYGGEHMEYLSGLYNAAYEGSGLTVDEIWAEVICDSLGDMNIFAELTVGNTADILLQEVKAETQADAESNSVRGPPAIDANAIGKMSREHGRRAQRGSSIEVATMENNRFQRIRQFGEDLPDIWYAYTLKYLYVYKNLSFMDYQILNKIPVENRGLTDVVIKEIKSDAIRTAEDFNRRLKDLRSKARRHRSGNHALENRGAAVANGGVSGGGYGDAAGESRGVQEGSGSDIVKSKADRGLPTEQAGLDANGQTQNKVATEIGKMSREYSGKQVEWAVENGIITEQERVAFFRTIANINKLRHKVNRSSYGGYIIDLGNKLLFTDGDWKSPSLSSVIVFDDTSETTMQVAKDVILNGKHHQTGYEQSRQIIEDAYWPGYVERYTERDSAFYARENTRGEGTDRRPNHEGTENPVSEDTYSPDYAHWRNTVKEPGHFSRELEVVEVHRKRKTARAEEAEALKHQIAYWKGQLKRTKGFQVDQKSVDKVAKGLIRTYQVDTDADELSAKLKAMYDGIATGYYGDTEIDYETCKVRAEEVARLIVENAVETENEMYVEYAELRKYLRSITLNISHEDSQDIPDFGDFRKRNWGRMTIGSKGTNIDQVYKELSELWPEFFSEERETTPSDQLLRIAEVMETVYRSQEVNPFGQYAEEAVSDIADEVMGYFFTIPQAVTFADKAAAKLKQATADAKLAGQMAQGRRDAALLRSTEERAAAAQQRAKDALRKERERGAKAMQDLKDRQSAKDTRTREQRKAAELRGKIVRHAKALSKKLLSPTDKKHITDELQSAVAAVLDAINLESKWDSAEKTTKRTQAFQKLRDAYKKVAGDVVVDPALFSGDGDQAATGPLLEAVLDMGDTRIADMNSEQLATVWQVLKAVEASVRSADRLLAAKKYQHISEMADQFQSDNALRRPKKGGKRGSKMLLDLEIPKTFFHKYGEIGDALFRVLRNAQDNQQRMIDEIAEAVKAIVTPKQVQEMQKDVHEVKTESGDTLHLTTAHIMELYLLSKREQAQDHLLKGGIVQPEIQSKKIQRGTDMIRLSMTDISNITGKLTQEQTRIADALQQLMTTKLADYGNAASMTAYGYKKFTGKDYWPIKSAQEALHSKVEKGANNTRSIKNIGLAQQVVPHANTAMNLGGIFQTFSGHATDMIDYAAWLCPMEDVNRLFNFKYKDGKGIPTGKTVKGILDRVGGPGSQAYWSNLMEDIQNGIAGPGDTSIGNLAAKITGSVKGASVGANVRVIVQQPTAIVRAVAVMKPAYLARGGRGVTKGSGWKKALKYAEIAQRKNRGGFEISNPIQMSEILFDDRTSLARFNDAMQKGAAAADALAWGCIWNACEHQVKHETKLEVGTEAFYKKVAEVFTEVIEESQVVDGVLQRSQIMRSSNQTAKQMTSFMGEPTMSLNMLLRAYDAWRYEQNGPKKAKAGRTLARVGATLVATDLITALAQSLVDAIRDDDKEKKYWERFWKAFTGLTGDEETFWERVSAIYLSGNAANTASVIGKLPYAKDIKSLVQGYSVEHLDISGIADLINAGETVIDNLRGEGARTWPYTVKQLATAGSKLFGISASNILRDVWGIARSVAVETGSIEVQYEMEKAIYKIANEKNKGKFYDILFSALKQGDMENYNIIRKDLMTEMGIAGTDIDSAMKSRYTKALEKDPGMGFPQKAADTIGIVTKYGHSEPEEKFRADDLDATAYQAYSRQLANERREIMDGLETDPLFRREDGAFKDAAISAAEKLVKEQALEDHSDGQYEVTAEWIKYAEEAEAKGIEPCSYVLFHAAYTTIAGKEKSDKIRDWLKDNRTLTESQREFLWGTVYKSEW